MNKSYQIKKIIQPMFVELTDRRADARWLYIYRPSGPEKNNNDFLSI